MNESIKNLIQSQHGQDEHSAYRAGFSCGMDGPNQENCHFGFFAQPALTKAWEKGKRDAENLLRGGP